MIDSVPELPIAPPVVPALFPTNEESVIVAVPALPIAPPLVPA